MLTLDKPARVLTSPDGVDAARPDLMTLLHAGIAAGKPWAVERQLTYLNNPHRLDFDTSGILLLAKNKEAFMALADQLKPCGPVVDAKAAERLRNVIAQTLWTDRLEAAWPALAWSSSFTAVSSAVPIQASSSAQRK